MVKLASLVAACVLFSASGAGALTIDPFTGVRNSTGDVFQVAISVTNTDDMPVSVRMNAYDRNFRSIRAHATPLEFKMGAGTTRSVVMRIPFGDAKELPVRICALAVDAREMTALQQASRIGVRICGKYIGRRLR